LYLAEQLNDDGHLIAIDQDETAIQHAKNILKDHIHKVTFVQDNFRNLEHILESLDISKVDGVLYDLDVSSRQLDFAERGFRYGEEKFSKQIARKIEARRENAPIETTFELVDLIKEGIPAAKRRKGGHPAKRVFQAVRIAVNDELGAFEESIEAAIQHVKVGGRISVITFHSLEDRLCKQVFQEYEKGPDVPRGLPVVPEEYQP